MTRIPIINYAAMLLVFSFVLPLVAGVISRFVLRPDSDDTGEIRVTAPHSELSSPEPQPKYEHDWPLIPISGERGPGTR